MNRNIKKILLIIAVVIAAITGYQQTENTSNTRTTNTEAQSGVELIAQAFKNRQSDVQVQGSGQVIKILPDDNEGSRHQKFILKLSNGQTVLVSHNIDLAPKITNLQKSDSVEFFGEYEWTEKGGVIHWTHHDPRGKHVGGWLKHEQKTYQ